MDESRLVTELEDLVRTLSDAATAPDVFRTVFEGLALAAPRAAVYLVRQNQLKGWRCVGYAAGAGEGLRSFSVKADSPASRIGTDGLADRRADGTAAPNFGQPAPHESVAVTVTVRQKPIALIVAERNAQETPWQPAALSLLAHAARLRLELSLAERKIASASTSETRKATTSAPSSESPRTASPGAPQSDVSMPATPTPVTAPTPAAESLAEAAGTHGLSPAQPAAERRPNPRIDAAKRFARLVATDIRLYNEEAVVLGRRNGDLADRLGEPIALGQRSFAERFGDMGSDGAQVLQQALVDVLAGGDPNLLRL